VPLTPCLTCGALCSGSYCAEHKPGHGLRGSGGKQTTFRRRTLARTGGRCALCGSRENVEAHHPVALAVGGTHDQRGVPLCAECHRALHAP
jgi:5-methylcytosine-specific restriction endonuclease McrA